VQGYVQGYVQGIHGDREVKEIGGVGSGPVLAARIRKTPQV
jgi:hypothetical protein